MFGIMHLLQASHEAILSQSYENRIVLVYRILLFILFRNENWWAQGIAGIQRERQLIMEY